MTQPSGITHEKIATTSDAAATKRDIRASHFDSEAPFDASSAISRTRALSSTSCSKSFTRCRRSVSNGSTASRMSASFARDSSTEDTRRGDAGSMSDSGLCRKRSNPMRTLLCVELAVLMVTAVVIKVSQIVALPWWVAPAVIASNAVNVVACVVVAIRSS